MAPSNTRMELIDSFSNGKRPFLDSSPTVIVVFSCLVIVSALLVSIISCTCCRCKKRRRGKTVKTDDVSPPRSHRDEQPMEFAPPVNPQSNPSSPNQNDAKSPNQLKNVGTSLRASTRSNLTSLGQQQESLIKVSQVSAPFEKQTTILPESQKKNIEAKESKSTIVNLEKMDFASSDDPAYMSFAELGDSKSAPLKSGSLAADVQNPTGGGKLNNNDGDKNKSTQKERVKKSMEFTTAPNPAASRSWSCQMQSIGNNKASDQKNPSRSTVGATTVLPISSSSNCQLERHSMELDLGKPKRAGSQFIDQLKPGGRLMIPIGPEGHSQPLQVFDKAADGTMHLRPCEMGVQYVPLTDRQHQWPDPSNAKTFETTFEVEEK